VRKSWAKIRAAAKPSSLAVIIASSISCRRIWPSKSKGQATAITYEHDVVIDCGEIRKRKKKPSKEFRDAFGHTPLSIEEEIPWKCQRLVIGTGTGALPVM
jgi:hypothetical protein